MQCSVFWQKLRVWFYKPVLITLTAVVLCAPLVIAVPAAADTMPPAGTPATVSADPLPTVQVNGIVYAQVTVGNIVYATGKFTQARPAGVAENGPGSVTRKNLLAYDIRTGKLIDSFTAGIEGVTKEEGRALAVSPDGTKLYVGGAFTTANGQPRRNIAAFNLPGSTLASGFTNGTDGTVYSLAATNTQVYVGGKFGYAGGQRHNRLASYTAAGSIIGSWAPNVTSPLDTSAKENQISRNRLNVASMVVVPSTGNLVFGGHFSKVNGATRYSTAAVKLTTGELVTPWASSSNSFPARNQLTSGAAQDGTAVSEFSSMSTDGTQVFVSSRFDGSKYNDGSVEGRMSISAKDGKLIWINDCYGNSYGTHVMGKVLYSAGHIHNCQGAGAFSESTHQYVIAESTEASGKFNTKTPIVTRTNLEGLPRSSVLVWHPVLSGTTLGSAEVSWSVTGNKDYISVGGAFTKALGTPQQGLVRYTVASKAPNKQGPLVHGVNNNRGPAAGYAVTALPAKSDGTSLVRVYITGDPDNTTLTYKLYRAGSSTPIKTRIINSVYWKGTSWTYTDTKITPGTSLRYKLVITDPYGNSRTVNDSTVINNTDPRVTYSGSNWKKITNSSNAAPYFGRDLHRATTNGHSYKLTFTGTTLKLIGTKGADRGNISISIDGGKAVSVSAYNAKPQFQQILYTKTGLHSGKHTVKVTKTSGTYMDVDAIFVK